MDTRERDIRNKKTLSAVFIVLVVLTALSLYALCATLVSRFHFKADMTEGEVFKLTDTTKELLAGLDRDVSLICLASENDADTNITELLGRYERASQHVGVRYVDLAVNPAFTERYKAQGFTLQDDGVLVECGSKIRFIKWEELYRISSYTDASNQQNYIITGLAAESQLSAAIAAVTSDDEVKVAFTAGHSEDTDGRLGELITGSGYAVSRWVPEVQDLDPDTDVVLIAGARSDFSEKELAALQAHLDRGGSLVLFRDPRVGSLPGLDALCAAWGISVGDGIVLESSQYMGDPTTVIPVFGTSLINVYFSERSSYVVMPTARQLSLSQGGEGMVNSVLRSTNSSYAKPLDAFGSYDKKQGDAEGPFDLAATSERLYTDKNGNEQSQYLFVMGCTDFYADVYLDTGSIGNADFVLQLLSHISEHDLALNIPVKDLRAENIAIPQTFIVIFATIFVMIIPLTILFYGLVRFIKRKRA